MMSRPGELQPAQAVVQRMQALQTELQQAHRHLRRERRAHGVANHWGLEQTESNPPEEDWLITYLDMVTLLMVTMIVMLAMAGPITHRLDKHAASAQPAQTSSTLDDLADTFPYPAAPEDAFARSVEVPPIPAMAPLAGTFPDPLARPAVRPVIIPQTEPPDAILIFGLPNDTESKARDQARLDWVASIPVTSSTAKPAKKDPNAEGEALAASLPLGELGKDVEVIVNQQTVSFRINSEILFGTGQAHLSREGLAVLKRVAKLLVTAGYDVTVEGHTDSIRVRSSAPYPSNWELSSARAGSVVRYLESNGIPKSHLKAVGFADSRPIADNKTAAGRARNRRVELVVSKHRSDEAQQNAAAAPIKHDSASKKSH